MKLPTRLPYLPIREFIELVTSLQMIKKSTMGRCFGVIADIQYADADDATDFSGKQKRSYRNSLEIVKKAATVWKENGVEFVAQLGDIIDSRAKKHNGSQMECEKVLRELNKSGCNHLVNIIGNHELYNFSREELDKRLGVRMSGATWYSYKPWSSIPLRMVILDGYDISCIEGLSTEKTDEAKEYMLKNNPNDTNTFGVEWSKGLEGTNKRFMPYNGKIGPQQMSWLTDTLTQCRAKGESVILLTHIPIHPSAVNNLCLLWNYQEVLDVINASGVVVAVLAGHDHEGGYVCDEGVHHLTLSSPLLCQGEELAFMTVRVESEQLLLHWHGRDNVLPEKLEIKLSL